MLNGRGIERVILALLLLTGIEAVGNKKIISHCSRCQGRAPTTRWRTQSERGVPAARWLSRASFFGKLESHLCSMHLTKRDSNLPKKLALESQRAAVLKIRIPVKKEASSRAARSGASAPKWRNLDPHGALKKSFGAMRQNAKTWRFWRFSTIFVIFYIKFGSNLKRRA